MRLRFSTLFAATALSVCLSAHATQQPKSSGTSTKSPAKTTTPSAPSTSVGMDALAQVTGILSYCESLDKKGSAQYSRLLSNILSGYSPATIKSDQRSSQYETSLQAVTKSLEAISKNTVINSCRSLIPGV